jgi:ketosteroid isomerase-like protein
MLDRLELEQLVRGIYEARLGGNLDALCQAFSNDAVFRIAGAGQTNPISNIAVGIGEFRPLLRLMIKAFKLTKLTIHSILIDGSTAQVHSRVTGLTVPTELIDLIEARKGRIVSYTEFFVLVSRGAPINHRSAISTNPPAS